MVKEEGLSEVGRERESRHRNKFNKVIKEKNQQVIRGRR